MTDERYKDLMASVGMPNSRSLLGVLQQVANEVGQEKNEQIAALKAEIERLGDALVLNLFEGAEAAEVEAPVAAGPQQLHVSEMSAREHIPSKKESKILRQLGAKKKQKKQKKEQVKASAIGAGMLFEVQLPARIQICATQKQFIAFCKAALGKKLFAVKYKIVK